MHIKYEDNEIIRLAVYIFFSLYLLVYFVFMTNATNNEIFGVLVNSFESALLAQMIKQNLIIMMHELYINLI